MPQLPLNQGIWLLNLYLKPNHFVPLTVYDFFSQNLTCFFEKIIFLSRLFFYPRFEKMTGELNREREQDLREAGANDELINVIRAMSKAKSKLKRELEFVRLSSGALCRRCSYGVAPVSFLW